MLLQKEDQNVNTSKLEFQAKMKLQKFHSLYIAVALLIIIFTSTQQLTDDIVETGDFQVQLGIANILLLISLNKYFAYGVLAEVPNSLLFSIRVVFNGFVGVLPLVMGLSIVSTVYLYGNFRFLSIETSLFAFFYTMNGDTFFDTGIAAKLENEVVAFLLYFVVFNYMAFGVNMVALAMVEEGYLTAKVQSDYDWVIKKEIDDPCMQTQLE